MVKLILSVLLILSLSLLFKIHTSMSITAMSRVAVWLIDNSMQKHRSAEVFAVESIFKLAEGEGKGDLLSNILPWS